MRANARAPERLSNGRSPTLIRSQAAYRAGLAGLNLAAIAGVLVAWGYLMVICVLSLWRNDAERRLEDRAQHLLSKISGGHELRWLWVVGDSDDSTFRDLVAISVREEHGYKHVTILRRDTAIAGEDTATRRRRMSMTATALFAAVPPEAEYVVVHESDLLSGTVVIAELLLMLQRLEDLDPARQHAIAGWPTINLDGRPQFYDVWAYRDLHGRPFLPQSPFAKGYRRHAAFEVGSFGSVWLAPAGLVRGRVIETRAVLELCEQWRAEGIRLWCDPRIPIVQPVDLWSPQL